VKRLPKSEETVDVGVVQPEDGVECRKTRIRHLTISTHQHMDVVMNALE
jgi:hypothetical protein